MSSVNVTSFLNDLSIQAKEFLELMEKKEDWVLSEKDEGYDHLVGSIQSFTKDWFSMEHSYLGSQVMGWVSAPHCLLILKNLSQTHPDMVRAVFNSKRNDEVTEMVIERLKVLEKFAQLRQILDPKVIRSIERGIRHQNRLDKMREGKQR